ncbi:MAG: DUF4330 domain-containing protein [Clostridiales bacterium]|nr:DUF4330 domain-containing protein [Clostridiales bacterium]
MLIDDKGRIFGKVSIVDIILVILVFVAFGFLWYKLGGYSNKASITDKTEKIQIVFYQEEINNFAANNVNIGDPATEALQNIRLGKVTDIKLDKAISWGSDIQGRQVSSERKGYSSIYITMEGKGIVGPNGIQIGNHLYYIGETITLRAGNSIFYGKIYSVEKIKGDVGK